MFPPRRILVAIDFSEPSRVAFRLAARLAVHCQSELHVLFVEEPLLCAAARVNGIDLGGEARAELDRFILESSGPTNPTRHRHVVGGHAVEAICHVACREQADVIVLGTHGMSGVERLVFGSTAEGVLRRSPIPVLLAPPTWAPPSGSTTDMSGVGPVIVGVDFTTGSLEAAAAGCTLARCLGTSLELLHVLPVMSVIAAWQPHADRAMAQRSEYARTELARLARELGAGMRVETHMETGAIPERLADAARIKNGRHPLLVLGRRLPSGRGDAPGAIAYRVASLAEVPTLMFMEREPQ